MDLWILFPWLGFIICNRYCPVKNKDRSALGITFRIKNRDLSQENREEKNQENREEKNKRLKRKWKVKIQDSGDKILKNIRAFLAKNSLRLISANPDRFRERFISAGDKKISSIENLCLKQINNGVGIIIQNRLRLKFIPYTTRFTPF